MKKKRLILIGLDSDLVDQINLEKNFKLLGVIDKNKKKISETEYLGNDNDFIDELDSSFLCGLDNPNLKKNLIKKFYNNKKFVNFVSSKSYISDLIKFGNGNIFQRNVKVMANVKIGNHCKFNIDSSIHHDCEIGNFNTICPGARILGNVTLGNNVYIGSGAIILPKVVIGDDAIVGAGAVVTKNIHKNSKVKGIPAR